MEMTDSMKDTVIELLGTIKARKAFRILDKYREQKIAGRPIVGGFYGNGIYLVERNAFGDKLVSVVVVDETDFSLKTLDMTHIYLFGRVSADPSDCFCDFYIITVPV